MLHPQDAGAKVLSLLQVRARASRQPRPTINSSSAPIDLDKHLAIEILPAVLTMSSVEAARQRLKELEKAAHAAADAVEKADQAAYALQERQDKRRRREWDDDSEEEEDEEEDGDDDDDKMSDAEAKKENTEEFADEEADDFDFEAKQERFEQETNRCKIRATEAYK